MRYVYDEHDLEKSFDEIRDDFYKLQEDLDDFEESLDNLEVFIEDQHGMQYDGCLAFLKQLKEIIADCEIRFERYNGKYDANYEEKKHVQTSLRPLASILKKVRGDYGTK